MEAHERGEGSLAELARRFGVSEGWAEKVSAARHPTDSGAMSPSKSPRGSSRIALNAEVWVTIAGGWNHANVCTLYHIGPNYLVMEYIEGLTLG